MGGVLLDLCHELDLAQVIFPGIEALSVDCLGHEAFPGVDFATRVQLQKPGLIGTVAMDYLSPKSIRAMALRGRDMLVEVDFLANTMTTWADGGGTAKSWTFERNEMFLSLMRDFMALAEGRAPSDTPLLPRLDRVGESAALIADAWEARQFHGALAGGFE